MASKRFTVLCERCGVVLLEAERVESVDPVQCRDRTIIVHCKNCTGATGTNVFNVEVPVTVGGAVYKEKIQVYARDRSSAKWIAVATAVARGLVPTTDATLKARVL